MIRRSAIVAALIVATSAASAQTAPPRRSDANALPNMIEQRLKAQIGELVFSNIMLNVQSENMQTQLMQAQARITDLEKQLAAEKIKSEPAPSPP